MGKNYYNNASRFAEQEIVNYATKHLVSMSEIAEHMGIRDTELFCVVHNALSGSKRQEIKNAIDEIVSEREEASKEITLDDLVFVGKSISRAPIKDKKDIRISSAYKTKNNKLVVKIAFRNGIDNIIASKGYLTIALYKGRLYFRDCDSTEGYAITHNKATTSAIMYCSIYDVPKEVHDTVARNAGDYNVIFDEKLKLYYIEVDK